MYNNDDVNLVFETHKTNIKIADIGHYEIICLIFGGNGGNIKKMPTICANGEALVKMDCKGVAQSTALPLYSAR